MNAHLTEEQLARLAEQAGAPELKEEAQHHLQECQVCRSTLEQFQRTIRLIERADDPAVDTSWHGEWSESRKLSRLREDSQDISSKSKQPGTSRNLFGSFRPAWATAAGLILALVYPAYLGLVRLPNVVADLEELRSTSQEIAPWSGAVPLNIVSSEVRGGELPEPVNVTVHPSNPYIALGIELETEAFPARDELLFIRLVSPAGKVVWDSQVAIADARLAILDAGVLTVLIPSTFVREDSYRLKVLAGDEEAQAPLLDIAIHVSR